MKAGSIKQEPFRRRNRVCPARRPFSPPHFYNCGLPASPRAPALNPMNLSALSALSPLDGRYAA